MENTFGFAGPVVALLLNSLWEDALIALSVFGILRIAPQLNASTRYAIWWAALVAAFVVPLLSTIPFVIHHPAPPRTVSQPVERPAVHTTVAKRDLATDAWSGTPATESASVQPLVTLPTLHRLNFSLPSLAGALVFAIWATVAAAIVLRLAFALMQLEKLKRDAMPLPVEYRDQMGRWLDAIKGSRDVRLCVSDATEVPIAVGLFDAMILIPHHLLTLLTEDEVDQISLHELAHLRRSDDWTNGIQRLIQAILFFNPAIQLIGAQLDLEREVACDDWVLAQTGAVRPYALCLTKMAENTSWPHRAVPAPGVFITRKAISIRIERLLRAGRNIRTSISMGAASVAAVAIIAIAFIVTSVAPSIAFTQAQEPELAVAAKPAADSTKTSHATHAGKAATSAESAPAAATASHAQPPARELHTASPSIELNPVHRNDVAVNVQIPPIAPTVTSAIAPIIRNAVASADRETHGGCTGCDLSGVNWSGRDLHGQSFTGTDFTDANLSGANLSGASLTGCTFTNTNLRNANLRDANMMGCDLKGADLRGADLTGVSFTGADIQGVKFAGDQAREILSHCQGCDFSRMDLAGSNFSGIHIVGVDFSHANLENVNFSGSTLKGVDFSEANLRGIDVRGARFDGCDLERSNVDGVDFSKAEMMGTDFSDK
jgi:uncharacterized protein YjbI with pentapeptide repeats/beta-lactamase regulating signal transducer with metallopeptidase domain